METSLISAIVVAAIAVIAGEWFPYDRCDRLTCFSAIAEIVAIIWKPAFRREIGYLLLLLLLNTVIQRISQYPADNMHVLQFEYILSDG